MEIYEVVYLNIISGILVAYPMCILGGRILDTGQNIVARVAYVCLFMSVFGLYSGLVFELDENRYLTELSSVLTSVGLFVGLYISFLFETKRFSWKMFSVFAYLVIVVNVLNSSILYFLFNLDIFDFIQDPIKSRLIIFAVILLIHILVDRLILYKVNFDPLLAYVFMSSRRTKIAATVSILLIVSDFLLCHYSTENSVEIMTGISVLMTVYLMLYTLVLNSYQNSAMNLAAKSALLYQQDRYLDNLEDLYQSLKTLQDTYRVSIQELMHDINAGGVVGLESHLKLMNVNFEHSIESKINEMSHLNNIKHSAIKSLILGKFVSAKEQGVSIVLEVISEITEFEMKTNDLIRCLGILIDNAIESCSKNESKITIILLNDDGLKIIVRNPVLSKVSIKDVYKQGFSTKGKYRGLGLFSYVRICERYSNVFRETLSDTSNFTQILHIQANTVAS